MEVRKIRKIKNESIIAIPNILLDVMEWEVGDEVSIKVDSYSKSLIIKKMNRTPSTDEKALKGTNRKYVVIKEK